MSWGSGSVSSSPLDAWSRDQIWAVFPKLAEVIAWILEGGIKKQNREKQTRSSFLSVERHDIYNRSLTLRFCFGLHHGWSLLSLSGCELMCQHEVARTVVEQEQCGKLLPPTQTKDPRVSRLFIVCSFPLCQEVDVLCCQLLSPALVSHLVNAWKGCVKHKEADGSEDWHRVGTSCWTDVPLEVMPSCPISLCFLHLNPLPKVLLLSASATWTLSRQKKHWPIRNGEQIQQHLFALDRYWWQFRIDAFYCLFWS